MRSGDEALRIGGATLGWRCILKWGWIRPRKHEKWKCESRSQRGPVIGVDGRRVASRRGRVASCRVADLVERSGATCLEKMPFLK